MKIPYFVYGRPPLNRIPEISALVGVLQLASGRWKSLGPDEISFAIRCMLQRPGLYLERTAINEVVDQVMNQPDRIADAVRSVITPQTKPFHADQIRDRADLLEIIATSTEPDEKVIDVLERYTQGTEFERLIEKQSPTADQARTVLANVAAFKRIALTHEGSIDEFLDELDPLIDSSKAEPPDEPHVWIGSIHRAKGAQWPVVFVPGMASSGFPRDQLTATELEAERRLFYVAVTRATDVLYLAHPNDPDFQETIESIDAMKERPLSSPVSTFLWEMDLVLARHAGQAVEAAGPFETRSVERPEIANAYFKRFSFASEWSYSKRPKTPKPASTNSIDPEDLPPGSRIRHEHFGIGTVERWVDQRVLRVIFDSGDTRMLIAKQAPMTVLGEKASLPTRELVDITDDDIPF